MASGPIGRIEDRTERRDEVYHRTRVMLPDHRRVPATLVNLSPHGLMVRAEVDLAVGAQIHIALPVVGPAAATVRWSLGGRLGCSLDRAIDGGVYSAVLKAAGG